jgi:hypothetical protein
MEKNMFRVRTRNHSPKGGYTVGTCGTIKRRGRVILRPVSTRTWRGKLASMKFNESTRTRGILTNAGFVPETV